MRKRTAAAGNVEILFFHRTQSAVKSPWIIISGWFCAQFVVAAFWPSSPPFPVSSRFRPERPSNVVGRPKGQGQTTETFLDRRKKEANKSRVSNHNRRSMADRKRNKGMIPSWPAPRRCWSQRRSGWPGSGLSPQRSLWIFFSFFKNQNDLF